MKLSQLHTGERGVIVKVNGHGGFRKRIKEMGFVKGNKVSTGVVSYDGRESVVPLNLTDKFEEKPTATQLENLAAQLMDSNRVFAGNQSIKVEFARLQDSPEYASYAELMKCGKVMRGYLEVLV